VLQLIGNSIKREIRQSDQPVRYGGDEFVVILPDTGAEAVTKMAERIQQSISQTHCQAESGESLSVTITVGCATHNQETPYHCLEFLCHAADQELYKAKRARSQIAAAN
jgi:two-component system cell cycle response regulator